MNKQKKVAYVVMIHMLMKLNLSQSSLGDNNVVKCFTNLLDRYLIGRFRIQSSTESQEYIYRSRNQPSYKIPKNL